VLTHAALGTNDRGGRRTVVEEGIELGDPMYEHAARLVIKTRKASASYIQRRLHLGYTRSARLLDMMEREGLVGPLAGSKGREVLVPENYFAEIDETHELDSDFDDSDDSEVPP
jgi:S-DNA-T family DNA segregation ATPase FtsK/SpoIIIE